MNYTKVMQRLKDMTNAKNAEGMRHFGITPKTKLHGISIADLRKLAKETGKNHELALKLWDSGVHEARTLATIIDIPEKVTKTQMNTWMHSLDAWDVCDAACMNLFDKTPYAYEKAVEWSSLTEEFEKRAGFALMASLAIHDKESNDSKFTQFLPMIKREATDDRNYVKKAVNWALRQIGKRNVALNKKAIKTAKEIQKIDSKAARWIAADALRELQSENVLERLKKIT